MRNVAEIHIWSNLCSELRTSHVWKYPMAWWVGCLPASIFKLVSLDSHLSPVERKIVCRGQGACHHWGSVMQKDSSSVYLGKRVRPQNKH